MKTVRKISFLIEEMAGGGPAQQLLDRFLMGYPREGSFHKLEGCQIAVWLAGPAPDAELRRREQDFGLIRAPSLEAAVAAADGIVIVPGGGEFHTAEGLLRPAVTWAAPQSAIFVHGALAGTIQAAKELAALASRKHISLFAGTATAQTWRLPEVEVPRGLALAQALMVVQGSFPQAELEALNGLFPIIERRQAGNSGVRRVRYFEGPDLWRAGDRGDWSWALLAAAISRSDSPQGDSVRDGRTQDLIGLGLVPKLASAPRGWVLEHADGLRSAVLVLDGVIADFDFAVQARGGQVFSAQLYRPPPPEQHHFSRLAAVIETFFRTGHAPGSPARGWLAAGLLEAFTKMRSQGLRELDLSGFGCSSPKR